jgi:succinoglycan biosynthesis protein ExoV
VDWQGLCDRAGVHNISPTGKLEDVLEELLASELIIAEAMHGAIIADAFRIPWMPVRYGYRSFFFKWHDWCQSIGLRYEPVDFPPILQAGLDRKEKLGRIARLGLSMTGIGKAKWRRTPIAVSSQREIDDATDFLRKLAASSSSVLSADGVCADAVERLSERLEDLRRDFTNGNLKPS